MTPLRTLHPDKTMFSTTWRLPTKDILSALGIPVPEGNRVILSISTDILGENTEIVVTEISGGR